MHMICLSNLLHLRMCFPEVVILLFLFVFSFFGLPQIIFIFIFSFFVFWRHLSPIALSISSSTWGLYTHKRMRCPLFSSKIIYYLANWYSSFPVLVMCLRVLEVCYFIFQIIYYLDNWYSSLSLSLSLSHPFLSYLFFFSCRDLLLGQQSLMVFCMLLGDMMEKII